MRAVCRMLMLWVATSAAVQAVPFSAPELDRVLKRVPHAENGARLYEACAACHGARGEGVSDGSVPAIGGQHFNVLAKALVDFRSGSRTDARMAHFADSRHLAISQEVADVAIHVSRLPPPASRNSDGEAPHQTAMFYARSCERCHGTSGEGNADQLVPRIAGQHVGYVLARLQTLEANERGTMPVVHALTAAKLPRDEMVALASYIASLDTGD